MGIFSRISDIFKSNVNDALDKAEDPEKMLKQMIIEMEESVNKATLAVANSIANEKSLERKLEKARLEMNDWEKKAVQALQANREDLARAALEKKNIAVKNVADLEPIYQTAKVTADKMRQQLNSLKAKLDEARSRQRSCIARGVSARPRRHAGGRARRHQRQLVRAARAGDGRGRHRGRHPGRGRGGRRHHDPDHARGRLRRAPRRAREREAPLVVFGR